MRLLYYNDIGQIRLRDFRDSPPPYAILSHIWGQEEVTFQDVTNNTGTHKAGYEKIRFCGQQARRDGLQFFWVDSCCIDKTNNTELTRAINSMFAWYRQAARCYVYLSDVPTRALAKSNGTVWEEAFMASRWFTRGWTLQELLAPEIVEFYTKEGIYLGTKASLEREIHRVTRISVRALRGYQLSALGVKERMEWANGRNTTEQEDWAYSLLGIFGVSMPLIYGEGRDNSIRRLKEEINKRYNGEAASSNRIYEGNRTFDQARAINGDVGGIVQGDGRSQVEYRSNEASGTSFQVNGSIDAASFQAFLSNR